MSESNEIADVPRLELEYTIGFNGHIPSGLHVHPDSEHVVYPVGCNIIIEEIKTQKQRHLTGHTNSVSCVAVSKSGRFIASGQMTHMGFTADVIVWDYEKREVYAKFTQHKVKVEALAFSPNEKFLASLGGQDDNSVVVWDLERKEDVCGSPAAMKSAGTVFAIAYANTRDDVFVTGGNGTLRIWKLDLASKKIRATDCNLGQLKRVVKCLQVSQNDDYVYCGTTSGDVLQINMNTNLLTKFGPQKNKYSLGILSMALLKSGEILIGTGNGTVAVLKGGSFAKVKSSSVSGPVTSVTLRGVGHQFFVGTASCQISYFMFSSFEPNLLHTSHADSVTDICFAWEASILFGTSSANDVRIWNAKTGKELLRIAVANMICNAFTIAHDGRSIVTGWNDGKIRTYTPETGKLVHIINDAHNEGVTAVATTHDSSRIVSGGGEGQVRIWDVATRMMKHALKEHRGAVSSIKVRQNDAECVSASTDGTCIIWDLRRFVRNQIIFANTLFMGVCYNPSETQIITCGTDRQIGYWETFDGSQIRELEASATSSINGMDISSDGKFFVTGSEDKLIKVWLYNEGEVTHIGSGHSGKVTQLRISPDQKHIVSVSNDGAIFKWKCPNVSGQKAT